MRQRTVTGLPTLVNCLCQFTAASPVKTVTQACQRVDTSFSGNKQYPFSPNARTEDTAVHIMLMQKKTCGSSPRHMLETRLRTPYHGVRSRPIGRSAVPSAGRGNTTSRQWTSALMDAFSGMDVNLC